MRGLFPTKVSALGALSRLALLSGLGICFCLALPAMLVTTLGKVFAAIWCVMTLAAMSAQVRVIAEKRSEMRLRRALNKLSGEFKVKPQRARRKVYFVR